MVSETSTLAIVTFLKEGLAENRSELHASPHIHIWIGHTDIWIYMDKTIWEMLYMWASMKFLPENLAFLVFLYIKHKEKFVRSISEVKLPENCKGKTQNCLQLVLYIVIAKNWSKRQLSCS